MQYLHDSVCDSKSLSPKTSHFLRKKSIFGFQKSLICPKTYKWVIFENAEVNFFPKKWLISGVLKHTSQTLSCDWNLREGDYLLLLYNHSSLQKGKLDGAMQPVYGIRLHNTPSLYGIRAADELITVLIISHWGLRARRRWMFDKGFHVSCAVLLSIRKV